MEANLNQLYLPAQSLGGADATIGNFISPIIYNVLLLSGIFALFVIIFAGFNFISASGEKAKIAQAQNMLTYGIMGFVVIVLAYLITKIISALIGYNFLQLPPTSFPANTFK